uniref:Integrase catalytic domain-containing protein n=1 Tax=Caenorhabditis tropicalis TaxID=1561998 RepID=A0A1I7UDU8_9PELO
MRLETPSGDKITALIDSGASLSVILTARAHALQLEIKGETRLSIAGFNSSLATNTKIYVLSVKRTDSEKPLSFLITGTPSLPNPVVSIPALSREDKSFMARKRIVIDRIRDDTPKNTSSIEMIIGNDMLPWLASQPSYKKVALPSGRSVEVTPLGTIIHPKHNLHIYGTPHSSQRFITSEQYINYSTVLQNGVEPEDALTKLTLEVNQMWRVENLGIEDILVRDNNEKDSLDLVKAFNESVKFTPTGEIEVALPYNGNESRLSDNHAVAFRRLENLYSTLNRGENIIEKYNKIIVDQLKAGFIEEVTTEMLNLKLYKYFIPHRAVLKEDSLTTKLRIVLDASSHAGGKLSLNDCLHAGSNMITPILGILLRARCSRYIIVADIEKAFHQVRLQAEYRNVTCFLWLKDISKPPSKDNIKIFRFTRIPFGVSSSPFLLAAYIMYNLDRTAHPLNREIKENLYVDNALFCTNNPNEIKQKIQGTRAIFNDMNMNLREYIVNHEETMNSLDPAIVASADSIKLLGYQWDRKTDTFTVKIAQLEILHPTKREVAALLASTFDPLGFVSPIMVPFKRLIQKIWETDVTWKQLIPAELVKDWTKLRYAFADRTISVPRPILQDFDVGEIELLVFTDASQDIYAANIYVYQIVEGAPPHCRLLTSKSKIRPSKNDKYTVPKMELVGIECGSNLVVTVIKELRLPIKRVRIFTDSSCALYWVLTSAQKRVWVANRVNTIVSNMNHLKELGIETTIHHVPTNQNPADLATRGVSTTDLRNNKFWFQGPSFLERPQSEWPCKIEGTVSCPAEFQDLVLAEIIDPVAKKSKKSKAKLAEKEATIMHINTKPYETFVMYDSYSSLDKLVRVVYNFLTSIQKFSRKTNKPPAIIERFSAATSYYEKLKIVRCLIITEHYRDCKEDKLEFPKNYEVYKDIHGLMRCKKNVASVVLPAEAHEPILIHHKHTLATLIIRETHENGGHLPASYTVAAVRTQYWIPYDCRLTDTIIKRCVTCSRVNRPPFAYPSSKVLPACRTTPSRPFSKVGLDYMGPLTYIRDDGESLGKAYALIYTCLTTRATALRLVPDGSATRYIMSLKMIFGEVGVPEDIYSDNAPTFKLGTKVINQDINDLEISESLTSFIASKEINYRNITPYAPWQGGIYERVVGLVKRHIHKGCGNQKLDYHSLQSPNDIIALRPCDFMYPGVLIAAPATLEKSFPQGTTEKELREHVGKLEETLERIWELWAKGYLLHIRQPLVKRRNHTALRPRVGQVVIMDTPSVQRHKWPLAIIVQVHKSPRDGEIRSATVRSKGKNYTRAVNQLIPLETEPLNHLQDAEDDTDSTALKFQPVLPTAATFDTPSVRYAPVTFPTDILENIAETSPKILNRETFDNHTANHPSIGEEIPLEQELAQVQIDDMVYQDPTTVPPDYVEPPTEARVSDGRTRDYLPRAAKNNPHYVFSIDYKISGAPLPPGMSQKSTKVLDFSV